MNRSSSEPHPSCVWPVAAELGEGPIWSGEAVWFTDIKRNRLHRFEPAADRKQVWEAPAPTGFLAPLADGRFIVGAKTGLLMFDPTNSSFERITVVEPQHPHNRLNDGAVDAAGRLWFGSMDDGETLPTGVLYRFDRGHLTAVDSGYVVTNGPAFSPDGQTLYHTDSMKKIIYAFDLGASGAISNKRIFVRIEDGAGYPDGSVCDAEGCLWTGLFAGWGARRYSPAGELLSEVRFPCANVTKLAFAGADLTTVYATTARQGLDAQAREAQPLAGGLFCFQVPVPGLTQHMVKYA